MSFKYYPGQPSPPSSASTILRDDFQALVTEQFSVATDIFTISEEIPFASGSYVDLRVRINSAISQTTGQKLGDDYKNFLFEDLTHAVDIGKKFIFDQNYWITINTEKTKNLAASCTVRRCNNMLRWMLSDGTYAEEPVIIEYALMNPRDDVPIANPVMPGGYMKVYCQLNATTRKIAEGQRFLLGNPDNWVCYKVMGGGIQNYQNLKSADNLSAQLLTLNVAVHQVNSSTDDLVNGIADRYEYVSSGSSSAVNTIVVTPNDGTILESGSQIFDVRYYSGSSIVSGSFVFSVSGSNVPVDNYVFTAMTPNTFFVQNVSTYLDYPLSILCSGSSGSRIFDVTLAGAW